MTLTILESIKPVKNRLTNILQGIRALDVGLPEESLPCPRRLQICEIKRRLFDEKIMRVQMCIQSLQEANDRWIDYVQKSLTVARKREEKKKYEEVTIGEQRIFNLVQEAQEATTALTIYKKRLTLESRTPNQQHALLTEVPMRIPSTTYANNVNLPQLFLPIFNGGPR
uniref:Uncharacterized protein n=1 Tax=Loa loa TaxID=7209 RepID=A0A1I7VW72_LOALO